jgi:uncharacterized membrane protein
MATRRPSQPAFLAPLCLVFGVTAAPLAAGPVRYRVTDLGEFRPSAINDRGHVAGAVATGAQDAFGSRVYDAALYDRGVLRDLVPVPGDASSFAADINEAGQVVGYAATGGFLFDAGVLRPLGFIPAAINNAGQVAGSSGGRAVLYDGGEPRALGADAVLATDVNDAGRVVGLGADGPFLYEGGVTQNLTGLPNAEGLRINSAGQIIGNYSPCGGDDPCDSVKGLLYDPLSGLNLDLTAGFILPAGAEFAGSDEALGINDAGQVVGRVFLNIIDPGGSNFLGHAFLFQDGVMLDLNGLIPADGGWVLESATAINNRGQIVGTAFGPEGRMRGVLLTPTDGGPSSIPLPPGIWSGLGVLCAIVCGQAGPRRRSSG